MRCCKRNHILIFSTLLFLLVSFFGFGRDSLGAENQILISEVRLAGVAADGKVDVGDEFIELFNPHSFAVEVQGWSLKRKTSSGKTEEYLISDMGIRVDPSTGAKIEMGATLKIPAGGFFLIAPRNSCGAAQNESCYRGTVEPDVYYSVKSNYLAKDNSITLYDKAKLEVDKVGWGQAVDYWGNSLANPPDGQSLERKAASGNLQNTKDNAQDFFVQVFPNPQHAGAAQAADTESNAPSQNSDESPADNQASESALGAKKENEFPGVDIAAEKKISISEFLINPSGDDSQAEFIELYNAGSKAVDISHWQLEDQVGSKGKYIFPAGASISAGAYKVVYSSETKISLNNGGDGLILKDSAGVEIDRSDVSIAAKENISFAEDENQKWAWTIIPTPVSRNVIKAPLAQAADSTSTKEAITDKSNDTDAAESKSGDVDILEEGQQLDYSDNLFINEVLPDPLGRDNQKENFEWVELYNDNEEAVNLKGWYLDDILEKGSKAYRFLSDKIIPAKSYSILSSEETKLSFNNTSDEVNLLWPDGQVADRAAYAKTKEDSSYDLGADDAWFWTAMKTPGAKNVVSLSKTKTGAQLVAYRNSDDFTEVQEDDGVGAAAGEVSGSDFLDKGEYKYITISEAKRLPLKTPVGLDGVVSVPAGIYGKDIFYLIDKDTGAGMQMYSYNNSLPVFSLGDQVQVFGFLSEVGGERRLVLDDNFRIEKMSGDNLLKASALKCAAVDASSVGNLVILEGSVAEVVDDTLLYMSDESGKIKIYAKPGTGISFADIKAGERMTVTGHISRTSAGYRILPRFSSDLHFFDKQFNGIIETKSVDSTAKVSSPSLGLNLFFLFSLLILLDWIRVRMRAKGMAGLKAE